jgi:hypothetical protein
MLLLGEVGGDMESKDKAPLKPANAKARVDHDAKRRRREKELDEAIENSFPASDPISVEPPG